MTQAPLISKTATTGSAYHQPAAWMLLFGCWAAAWVNSALAVSTPPGPHANREYHHGQPIRIGTLAMTPGQCTTGGTSEEERRLLARLSRRSGRTLHWVCFDSRLMLRHAVRAHRVDMTDAHLGAETGLDALRQTSPIATNRPVVVTRNDQSVNRLHDFRAGTLAIRHGSPMAGHASAWQSGEGNRHLHWYSAATRTRILIEDLRAARFDALLMDQADAARVAALHRGLRISTPIASASQGAWTFSPSNDVLAGAAEQLLAEYFAAPVPLEAQFGDLATIRSRGSLRVLAMPERHRFFVSAGRLRGFDYELLAKFAEQQDVEVELIFPRSTRQGLAWLHEGYADIVTLAGPITKNISASLRLTKPFREGRYVVAAADEGTVRLALGARVRVAALGPVDYLVGLLKAQGIRLTTERAPSADTALDILSAIAQRHSVRGSADGFAQLALVESAHLDAATRLGFKVKAIARLKQPQQYRWATRHSNSELHAHLDRYISRELHSEFYNVLYHRYFSRTKMRSREHNRRRLSPYDDVVRRVSGQSGFDWRLVAAQMFEESGFNPTARSPMGAEGLMQILPTTGADLGLNDAHQPDESITAGVRYLRRLRDRYESGMDDATRTWFALAAYNAGHRRIAQARRLAGLLGLSQGKWFRHVERAMQQLNGTRDPVTGSRVHCRCDETIQYVRRIRARYYAYRQLLPEFSDHTVIRRHQRAKSN
ncbi:MAG: transglycosylase SLT domain-containing protein [Chromatiales bacterium]|jgi:membrane-bound lytic murein transglycosylase F|nr:transglycosylase SLT domain-containing protein [Chromatiales bacterium]